LSRSGRAPRGAPRRRGTRGGWRRRGRSGEAAAAALMTRGGGDGDAKGGAVGGGDRGTGWRRGAEATSRRMFTGPEPGGGGLRQNPNHGQPFFYYPIPTPEIWAGCSNGSSGFGPTASPLSSRRIHTQPDGRQSSSQGWRTAISKCGRANRYLPRAPEQERTKDITNRTLSAPPNNFLHPVPQQQTVRQIEQMLSPRNARAPDPTPLPATGGPRGQKGSPTQRVC
jgi:hypothetical protein